MSETQLAELAEEIRKELYSDIGPLLFGKNLYTSLGFSSAEAFRQAVSRNTVPVEVFSLPNRRGKFALSRDVSLWLASERLRQNKEKII